ncbi:hypothetical protein [Methanobrevibacter sp.]|uniref:hypothetical protein n=1 Tax=Methanobrevibacter sp. TaxID=66852 RepID=UPI00388EDD5E
MLVEFLGDYPQIRVFDYLLMNPFGTYTKQQIAIGSEISRITLNKFIDNLINRNILIKNSNSKFSLNIKSPLVIELNKFLNELNKIEIENQMKNIDEPYDELSDDELDEVFDENAPDVDLNKLEQELIMKENYKITIANEDENFNIKYDYVVG